MRPRSRWCCSRSSRRSRSSSSEFSRSGCTTNEAARDALGVGPGISLDPAAALCVLDGFPCARVLDAARARRAPPARQLSPPLGGRAIPALFPPHLHPPHHPAPAPPPALHP